MREVPPNGAGRNRTLGLKKLEKLKFPGPNYGKQLWFDSLQAKVKGIRQVQSDNQKMLQPCYPSLPIKAFKDEL